MKVSAFIAVTADGFIARKNGALDWIPSTEGMDEDFGFQPFLESVDALVMGRKTYEFVVASHQWPYGNKKVFVLSDSLKSLSSAIPSSVEIKPPIAGDIYSELKEMGLLHVYVDGGQTIQSFLNAGLLSELILTQIPILIGDGVRLFGKTKKDIKLKHIETMVYTNGFVQNHYEVLK